MSRENSEPEQPLAGREEGSLGACKDLLLDAGGGRAKAVGGKADSSKDGTPVGRKREVSEGGLVLASSVGEARTLEVKTGLEMGVGGEPSEVGGCQIAELLKNKPQMLRKSSQQSQGRVG
jgi:hypothetical protein